MFFNEGNKLKGAGTVSPSSKYDIHKELRANFHSMSDRSYAEKENKYTSDDSLNGCGAQTLTEIIWYELDIIAISMFSKTIMLITEYDPNNSRPQNRVKLLIPVRSNAVKSTRPKPAQKSDWDVSNILRKMSTFQ